MKKMAMWRCGGSLGRCGGSLVVHQTVKPAVPGSNPASLQPAFLVGEPAGLAWYLQVVFWGAAEANNTKIQKNYRKKEKNGCGLKEPSSLGSTWCSWSAGSPDLENTFKCSGNPHFLILKYEMHSVPNNIFEYFCTFFIFILNIAQSCTSVCAFCESVYGCTFACTFLSASALKLSCWLLQTVRKLFANNLPLPLLFFTLKSLNIFEYFCAFFIFIFLNIAQSCTSLCAVGNHFAKNLLCKQSCVHDKRVQFFPPHRKKSGEVFCLRQYIFLMLWI